MPYDPSANRGYDGNDCKGIAKKRTTKEKGEKNKVHKQSCLCTLDNLSWKKESGKRGSNP